MTKRQTGQLKAAFLDAFRKHGIISVACREIGIHRSCVYRWQEDDERFLHDYRQAELESTEIMEHEAIRRAVDGVEDPVYQGGELVGTITRRSDTLLIFMLKSRKPEKYRDKWLGSSGDELPFKAVDAEAYSSL